MDREKLKLMIKQRIKEDWIVLPSMNYFIFYNPNTNYRTTRNYSGSLMTLAFNNKGEIIIIE